MLGHVRSQLADPGVRANVIGIGLNTMLTVLKFVVGSLAASEALVADGFNSAGDIFATGIGFTGYLYARKPADEDHHYGHGNAESVAGLIIGGVLLATGVFIFLEGVRVVVGGKAVAPGVPALWIAALTMVVKEGLYRYTTHVGRKLNSPSLLASARDHRADVFIALTVFAGILAARLGVPVLDPGAALLVGLWIVGMSIQPIRANVAILMDQAPKELRQRVRRVAISDPDVREVEEVRIHPVGPYMVIDLEIYLDGSLSLHAAHDVAHRVGDRVRSEIEHVQDVKVHVNPTGPRPKPLHPGVPRTAATE
jgi:cation diffusion facilitator family transporter